VTIVNPLRELIASTWSYLPVIEWDYPPSTFVPWDPLPLNTTRKSVGGMASLVHYDSDENIVGAADPARAWHEGPVEASALEGKGPCTVHVFLLGSDLSIAPTKKTSI
jgi:hypothetical protein